MVQHQFTIIGSPVPVFLMMGVVISMGLTLSRKIPCRLLNVVGPDVACLRYRQKPAAKLTGNVSSSNTAAKKLIQPQ